MIHKKNKEEIASMITGGRLLGQVLSQTIKQAKVGVSELSLDAFAEEMIRNNGAEPGFMRVEGYKHTVCVSTNDVIVHGIPTSYVLEEADVIGIDCGVYLNGLHTDMSETVRVRSHEQKPDEIDAFLAVGKKALMDAIAVCTVGNRVGHISQTIQTIVEGAGYSVVRELVGHGVGKNLHEDPQVPGLLTRPIQKTPLLEEGMVIAVEVIYNMGKPAIKYGDDGWTIKTKDGSMSGVFERTVLIRNEGPLILTPWTE